MLVDKNITPLIMIMTLKKLAGNNNDDNNLFGK